MTRDGTAGAMHSPWDFPGEGWIERTRSGKRGWRGTAACIVGTALALALWLGLATAAQAGQLTVVVHGVKSTHGQLVLRLWKGPDGFPREIEKVLLNRTASISGETVTIVFDSVEPGAYAITLYHDENGNDVMDKNFLGIPKEGYGVSNDVRGFGYPNFEDSKFAFDGNSRTLEINMNY